MNGWTLKNNTSGQYLLFSDLVLWRMIHRGKSRSSNDSATLPSSISWQFRACFQHLHVLDNSMLQHFYSELFNDDRLLFSSPFLSSSFRTSRTGTTVEYVLSATFQVWLAMLRLQLLRCFQDFRSIFTYVSML